MYVNARLAALFNATEQELLALESVADLVHPDDQERVRENLRARLEGRVEATNYEFRGVRRDGSVFDVQVSGQRIEWEGEAAVMGTLIDLTASKRQQREYHERQRREALARLATGVAHDFNNILGVIQTMATLLRRDVDDDAPPAADLDEIIAATERAAALSKQLTTFGRGLSEELEIISVGDIVEDLSAILSRLAGRNSRLEVALTPDLPPVQMHPADLEAIVMNLVANAMDALPDGGTVRIETELRPGRRPDAPDVALVVQDDGVGIDPRVIAQIFEPYFTTKGDRGTGLGLGNVQRIVSELGGEVDVQSRVGEGSTFTVLIPAAVAATD